MIRRMHSLPAVGLALGTLVPAAAGCFSYHAAERPRPGAEVRAELQLSRGDAGEETLRVEGTATAATRDSLFVKTRASPGSSRFESAGRRDTVGLSWSRIESVQVQRFDLLRTAAVAGAGAAGAVAVVLGALHRSASGSSPGGEEGAGPLSSLGAWTVSIP